MPYEEHIQLFDLPEGTTIWRYMNFMQLISVLEKEALFFSSAANFDDPFEGSVTQKNVELREKVKQEEDLSDLYTEGVAETSEEVTNFILLNCWHMNDYESAAMWDLYSRSDDGIAIRSTTDRLADSFAAHDDPVFLSPVEYRDYTKQTIPQRNMMHPFIFKRKSFEHENELRAIVMDLPTVEISAADARERGIDEEQIKEGTYTFTPLGNYEEFGVEITPGKYISVDLGELIEQVYVSPSAPHWVLELIESTMETYGFSSVDVIKSSIYDDPVY